MQKNENQLHACLELKLAFGRIAFAVHRTELEQQQVEVSEQSRYGCSLTSELPPC